MQCQVAVAGSVPRLYPADIAGEKEELELTKYNICCSVVLSIFLHIKSRIKEILEKCKPFICDPQLRCGRECRAVITTPSPIIPAMTGGCWTPLTAMTNHIKHPVILNHNNNWCNGSHKHNHHYKDSFYLYQAQPSPGWTFWCWEGREQTSLWSRVATKIGTMTGDISFDE